MCSTCAIGPKRLRSDARLSVQTAAQPRPQANGRLWRATQWLIGVAIERDGACAIASHSLEPALANSAPAHLLQSFWLLSEHWACAAELSKPVFFNTTFCE